MKFMDGRWLSKIGLSVCSAFLCGTLTAQQIGEDHPQGSGTAPDASRITFGTNFAADPCDTCKYNSEPSGYAVWGRDNCSFPSDVQAVAVPFVAAASGVPDRISTSIILNDPVGCPTNKVTLGLYTDTCGDGPGTLLAQAIATVADAPCGLTVAKLIAAPAITAGTKFWVTATARTRSEAGLDSRWYASHDAAYAFNLGTGWVAPTALRQPSACKAQGQTWLAQRLKFLPQPLGATFLSIPATGVITIPTLAVLTCADQGTVQRRGRLIGWRCPLLHSEPAFPDAFRLPSSYTIRTTVRTTKSP